MAKAVEALQKEDEVMRKALFLDEVVEMLEKNLRERGYSLVDFLDHVFNPDQKFCFDWQWKSFFTHQMTVWRIFEYWTTSKYSMIAHALVLDFATSLVAKRRLSTKTSS